MTWISVFNGAKFVVLEIILAVYLASHVDDVVKNRHNNIFKLWAERGKSRSFNFGFKWENWVWKTIKVGENVYFGIDCYELILYSKTLNVIYKSLYIN